MAIGTGAIIEFFGTQDTVAGSGATVGDGVFAQTAGTWTNDDDAPMASIVLSCSFSVAPANWSTVNLYATPLDVQSTNDGPKSPFLGTFVLKDQTAQQYYAIDVKLPNNHTSQEYTFYIENNGGQTMDADWTLYITPKTYGPHP